MKFSLALMALSVAEGEFVKGTFHQHAAQPLRSCHYAASDIDACGGDMMHEQDDGGTSTDVLLEAIVKSQRGYAFVGIVGNEEPPFAPKKTHGLVTLDVTENQIGAMCTKGDAHCKSPCDPEPPAGSGPWTTIDINNLHREYIQGVPGYFVQHPTTDPQRTKILAHMESGVDNLRGMEVHNSWVEQAWDLEIPLNDTGIDPLYPFYKSGSCLAWGTSKSCHLKNAAQYWDSTLRAVKRPIYGIADDDGFVYTGYSDGTKSSSVVNYKHGKKDVQTDTASWFRFGNAWSMVDVPTSFTAADVSEAVDNGKFYASTGIGLSYDTTGDIITVTAIEPVVFAVAGGVGDQTDATPLTSLNISLCANADGSITNVGCAATSPPPAATELQFDLREISGSFFFVRVQALVRSRYLIKTAPSSKASTWEFELDTTPNPADVAEGRLLRATGETRRPFVVQSVSGNTVKVVKSFSKGWGDITPDSTKVTGIVAGTDQLVAERAAWMQPVFRKLTDSGLVDPFVSSLVV